MYIPKDPNSSKTWAGWTLFMPSVSIGNVGQLAMDIFLNKTRPEHVGYLHDSSLLPMVGNHSLDMYGGEKCELTISAQVYEDPAKRIVFVQIRSPLVQGRKFQFVERISDWIKSAEFGRVFVIASLHSYERVDSQMSGTQLRWLASPELKVAMGSDFLQGVNWMIELERRQTLEEASGEGASKPDSDIFLPGSGFAKELYSRCASSKIAIGVFTLFCAEGNNTMDAITLASATDQIILETDWSSSPPTPASVPLKPTTNLTLPSSWKYMFGNTFDESLFQ